MSLGTALTEKPSVLDDGVFTNVVGENPEGTHADKAAVGSLKQAALQTNHKPPTISQ